MPRNRKRGTFSGGIIEWMGDDELLRKIEQLSSKEEINRICFDALTKSSVPVRKYMDDFLDTHLKGKGIPWPYTQVTLPEGKGQSKRNYNSHPWWKGNKMSITVGYDFNDYVKGNHEQQGALQALFLDIGTKSAGGTPRIVPTFFVYYGVRNSLAAIEAIQNETVARHFQRIWASSRRSV